MKVLDVRNVHEALPAGLRHLTMAGIERGSRNGPVLLSMEPVATVYRKPTERVLFYPKRDYNVFFNLYESLWMLAGRNDVKPLIRYVKNFMAYSDDGLTVHGAYGHRWRRHFKKRGEEFDQLKVIAERLRKDETDRRSVLGMWDPAADLGSLSKDVPCNDTATFQVSTLGQLDLTVFCRSNDVIWGAYFANAYHFSLLLEYMAGWIGVPVGVYTQISVNYHAYLATLEPLRELSELPTVIHAERFNPYAGGTWTPPLFGEKSTIEDVDDGISLVLRGADSDFEHGLSKREQAKLTPYLRAAYLLLEAHSLYRKVGVASAIVHLQDNVRAFYSPGSEKAVPDIYISGMQWLERRIKDA